MRNKKLISLVCALSMIFSLFSAFTVVGAEGEGEERIKLVSSLSEDGKTITIDATAVDITHAANFTINVPIPDGVTLDDITIDPEYDCNILTEGEFAGTFSVGVNATSAKGIELTNGKLVTITINLDKELSQDFTFELVGDSAIRDADAKKSYKISDGTLAVGTSGTTTVEKWVDPDAPAPKVDQPDKETEEEGGEIPTPVAPAEDEKGIALNASINATNTVVTIDAVATGGITHAANFTVNINIPEGVTLNDITIDPEYDCNILTEGEFAGTFSVGVNATSAKGIELTNGKLVTITIKLPTPLTSAYAFTLVGDSAIRDADAKKSYKISDKTLTASSAVVTPAKEEQKVVKEVPLKNYVGSGYEDAISGANGTVYMTVEVKKADGSDAVYGVDYAAEYNGQTLTKAAYNNLIHGYTDGADMADVINNLKFKIYSDDVKTITTTLNSTGDDNQLIPSTSGNITTTPPPATPAPAKGSMELKAAKTSIGVNTITTVTATVTVPADAQSSDANVKFSISGTKLEFTALTPDADGIVEVPVTDGKAEVKVNATDKTGSETVKATYSYVNSAGTAVPLEKTVTIKVVSTSETTSSGSSTSGKTGGSIARGSVTNTNTNSGKIAFTDLDTVVWAQDAILALVDKGVVNGMSNTIFDPNGNVTRAQFAKMVVLAFGLTGGSSGNFTDVPADAWYTTVVETGYYNGVISGYDDGTFRPDGLISRQEMAAMISRAIKAANKTLPATVAAASFEDAWQIGDWAVDAVNELQQGGVINGMTDTTFEPLGIATRAQAAVIIYRAINNAK